MNLAQIQGLSAGLITIEQEPIATGLIHESKASATAQHILNFAASPTAASLVQTIANAHQGGIAGEVATGLLLIEDLPSILSAATSA